jgi:hypothetical protein
MVLTSGRSNSDELLGGAAGDRDFTQAQKLINTTILSVSLFKKLVMAAA